MHTFIINAWFLPGLYAHLFWNVPISLNPLKGTYNYIFKLNYKDFWIKNIINFWSHLLIYKFKFWYLKYLHILENLIKVKFSLKYLFFNQVYFYKQFSYKTIIQQIKYNFSKKLSIFIFKKQIVNNLLENF